MAKQDDLMKKRNAFIQNLAEHHSTIDGVAIFGTTPTLPYSNSSYYVNVPQVLRRCVYLDSDEINILIELFSWMDGEGVAKVEQSLISLKTGIPLRTVKEKMTGKGNSLKSKRFIEVAKRNRSNVYIVQKLDFNPYIILSEMAHGFVEYYYYKGNLRSLDWTGDEPSGNSPQSLKWILEGEQSITSWRQHLAKVFKGIVTDKVVFMKYVQSIVATCNQDYVQMNREFQNELLQEVLNKREVKDIKVG
ncbi:hypothetical protein [Paenibacillus sp. FSL H3-0286]|uniref:hypothetical protein n=1 Tax=Paenibacillus sp. FSL H3-0286 TaxID=2921427 RepID=UPI00324F1670